jgi:hypothetical protein
MPTIPRSHLTLGLAESYLRLRLGTLPYPTGLSALGRFRQLVSSALSTSCVELVSRPELSSTKIRPRSPPPGTYPWRATHMDGPRGLVNGFRPSPRLPRGFIWWMPPQYPRLRMGRTFLLLCRSWISLCGVKLSALSPSSRRSCGFSPSSAAQTLAERPLRSFMMQVVRGKRSQTSSPSEDSAPLALRPTWILETAPYATKEKADRIWRQATRSLTGAQSPLSQSSFTGGNTLKVMNDVEHPRTGKAEAKVALDTQSDVTTCLREYLSDIRPIIPDTISGCGGSAEFDEEDTLHIYSQSTGRHSSHLGTSYLSIALLFLVSRHFWSWRLPWTST